MAPFLYHKSWNDITCWVNGPFLESQSRNDYIYMYLPGVMTCFGKSSYFNLPPDIGFTLFTPIKGRIDSLTVYIYKAETCTNILRYNTCMSSYPGDRKWTKIEP